MGMDVSHILMGGMTGIQVPDQEQRKIGLKLVVNYHLNWNLEHEEGPVPHKLQSINYMQVSKKTRRWQQRTKLTT
jgi:dihydroneopterin aldolase